jgi:hypothetical protein
MVVITDRRHSSLLNKIAGTAESTRLPLFRAHQRDVAGVCGLSRHGSRSAAAGKQQTMQSSGTPLLLLWAVGSSMFRAKLQ